VNVYVVRHAKAGSRSRWEGPDELRPLSKNGRRQAEAIADLLANEGVARILSSPFVRCVLTVEPLAQQLGLPVETTDELKEGASLQEALRLVEKVSDKPSVLCTHGDVIGELLGHASRHGVRFDDDVRLEKGGTWVLDVQHGLIVEARYLPPPA
jgi:8-oxo-dGTP diphosphatase